MDMILYAGFALAVVAIISSSIGRRREVSEHRPAVSYETRPAPAAQIEAPDNRPKYSYARKQFIMSKAENDFYKVLQQVVGSDYVVFPQINLDTFINHKVNRQDYRAALSVIQRKSVDYLICSREYYNPIVAIELDDASHSRPDRIERDQIVEGIFQSIGMPLVRIRWQSNYDLNEIYSKLSPYLK